MEIRGKSGTVTIGDTTIPVRSWSISGFKEARVDRLIYGNSFIRIPEELTVTYKIHWDPRASEELELFFAVLKLRQALVALLLPKMKWWVAAVMDPKRN